jgi:hypothetical protein
MSYQYLVGAEIDYKEDLQGAQFVIKNPNATSPPAAVAPAFRPEKPHPPAALVESDGVDPPAHGRPGRPLYFAGPAFPSSTVLRANQAKAVASTCNARQAAHPRSTAHVQVRATRPAGAPSNSHSMRRRRTPASRMLACGPWCSSVVLHKLCAVSSSQRGLHVGCSHPWMGSGAGAASSQARLNRSRPVLLGGRLMQEIGHQPSRCCQQRRRGVDHGGGPGAIAVKRLVR